MIADVGRNEVSCLVPSRFARHRIIDGSAVDVQSLEGDVLDFSTCIISVDEGDVWSLSLVADIAECDVLHSSAWSSTVFFIPRNLYLEEAALNDVLDANIAEQHITNKVVVATIDGKTALIVHLCLSMAKDVEVLIHKPNDAICLNAFVH